MTKRSSLDALLEKARKTRMSPDEAEEQRRSFAYGNTHIENADITRDMIDAAADEIDPEDAGRLLPD